MKNLDLDKEPELACDPTTARTTSAGKIDFFSNLEARVDDLTYETVVVAVRHHAHSATYRAVEAPTELFTCQLIIDAAEKHLGAK